MPEYFTLKECLYDTIHRNRKPLKAIAEEIGMAESYLTRAALPDQDESDTGTGCRFPLKRLIPLIRATGDFRVLDFIERSLGRVAVPLPDPAKSSRDIYRLSLQSVREFGELMGTIEKSLEDGKLSKKETETIQREGHEAIQAIVNLLSIIEKRV